MTRVDFYVLPDSGGRLLLACRLAEKAYGLGHRVFAFTDSAAAAERVDELLWTFKQNSFVPHALLDARPPDDRSPVLIGHADGEPLPPAEPRQVLLNLAADVPPLYAEFERVIEVVDQDSEALKQSRARFRRYREAGLEPGSHHL